MSHLLIYGKCQLGKGTKGKLRAWRLYLVQEYGVLLKIDEFHATNRVTALWRANIFTLVKLQVTKFENHPQALEKLHVDLIIFQAYADFPSNIIEIEIDFQLRILKEQLSILEDQMKAKKC